jgi:phosphatidylserine/phosphatidylglycerophosphate/cardiolipin synthase-like enzyme
MRFTAIVLALAAVLSSARGGAGSLDPTFGVRGKVTTAIGSSNHGFAVAIDRDGKIVVAGNAVIGSADRGGHSDTDYSSVLHVADLGLVVAN